MKEQAHKNMLVQEQRKLQDEDMKKVHMRAKRLATKKKYQILEKEDNDKNWLLFMRDYETRGNVQQAISDALDNDKIRYLELIQEEADFKKFAKEFGV